MRRRNARAEEVRHRVPCGAVTIVRETGKPIAEVARDLGVGAGTRGNWVHKDRMARGDGPDRTRVDAAYVRQLARELAEVRMERDVFIG
jgi:transposase-like protein